MRLLPKRMELEVSERTGAAWGEGSPQRVTHRNGYQSRPWETQVGVLELCIPKLCGQLPSEPAGVATAHRPAPWRPLSRRPTYTASRRARSTRSRALGMTGVSAESVSRLCTELDGQAASMSMRRRWALPLLW